MIYIIILTILLFFMIFGANGIEKVSNYQLLHQKGRVILTKEKIAVTFFLFLCWFLTAFRGETIGNDTLGYLGVFSQISTKTSVFYVLQYNYMEEGFHIFLYMVSQLIGTDTQNVLIATATVCYMGIGYIIFKHSRNYYISVSIAFLYCFSMMTNTIRQGIAVVICLFAYEKIKNGKKVCGIFLIVLAMTFHLSAGVMFLLFLKKMFPKSKSTMLIVNGILIVISSGLFLNPILARLFSHYAIYFESERVGNGRLALSVEILFSLIITTLAYISYENKEDTKLQLAVFESSTMFYILALNMSLIGRCSAYFNAIFIVELPELICNIKIVKKRQALLLIEGSLWLWFIVAMLYRDSWNHLYPYQLWITNQTYL